MTIDLCWQSILDSIHKYPALWTAVGFLAFWGLRFAFGHKLHLVTTCASRSRQRNRWYHRLDRISPFNLHDWQIYEEDWRAHRNYGVIPQSSAPLVCKRCRTVWRKFGAVGDQPAMDLYLRDGEGPLDHIQFDNSHIKTSDTQQQYRVEISLECSRCGQTATQPAVDYSTNSNQLNITLGDNVFDHPCLP